MFKFHSKTAGACLVLVLAGCAGFGHRDSDPTPVNSTAVLERHVVSEGNAEFPAFESVTLTYTRPNMQRVETSLRGGGGLSRQPGVADTGTRIERLDGKLAWNLDAKSRQYTECSLKGCPNPAPKKPPSKKPGDDDKGDAQCRLKIGNTTFTVESTGKKRSINGFDTEQYDVEWLVTFRDNASRKSTSTISVDLWATPDTQPLREAAAMEKSFALARDKLLDTDTNTDATVVLPPEVTRLLGNYLYASVSPTDRAAFLSGARKLDKVRGQAILMNVKWNFSGEACAMDKTAKDAGDKPLLTFMSEVKTRKLETLHDSLFAPPKDYKKRK